MAINIQQITDFLFQNKVLSIEKIGTLSVGSPDTTEEGNSSGIDFQYDRKANTTEELYSYIAEMQKKNLNLVRSDVDSFFEEARQLMNIGSRPLHLNGVGYIYSNRNEGYKFSEKPPTGFKESLKSTIPQEVPPSHIQDAGTKYKRGGGLKLFLFIIILALLSGIGYFVYTLIDQNKFKKNQNEAIVPESPEVLDTTQRLSATPSSNNGEKKFIFEITNNADRMTKRTTQLRGLGDHVLVDTATQNGVKQYKMYVPIQVSNMADTTKIKDSLGRYFGQRIEME